LIDWVLQKEKAQRQLEYAKAVNDKNTKEFMTRKPPTFPRAKDTQEDILSKRKLVSD
jgi:hypothetical protein